MKTTAFANTRCYFLMPILLGLFLSFPPLNVHAQPQGIAKNTIFFELGGNGLIYSINYDRLITKSFSLRIGYSSFSATVPVGLVSDQISVTIIPAMANYLYGDGSSRLELGAGISFVPSITTTQANFLPVLFGQNPSISHQSGSGMFFTSVIGYRYQPIDGGFNFRIGFTPLIVNDRVLPWASLSLGWTFN